MGGIFDDPKLVAELKEACATITKAIVQVNDIFGYNMTPQSFNQATRWINTKEEHCGKIIALVAEYCLCQRVKPVGAPGSPFTNEEDFTNALKAHHIVMQCAMKAKQSSDPAAAAALDSAVDDMAKMYKPARVNWGATTAATPHSRTLLSWASPGFTSLSAAAVDLPCAPIVQLIEHNRGRLLLGMNPAFAYCACARALRAFCCR